MKNIAIVLAAGKGSRMEINIEKQFMHIGGKPLMFYCLDTFEKSDVIDEVILVTNKEHVDYVKKDVVEFFKFIKVSRVIAGGSERVYSVWEGLKAIRGREANVFIHDSARPFIREDALKRLSVTVESTKACVAAMPSKDTVKLSDENGYIKETPKRDKVWIIQTPQVFENKLIYKAFEHMLAAKTKEEIKQVTDDAMVLEMSSEHPIKLVESDYENIKVTTGEDVKIAETFLKKDTVFK
ncbi:MAG: 2-C-methyl-D-erythritol 4-phosphate cytidylyltransferase [Suipraeoptans sp.]